MGGPLVGCLATVEGDEDRAGKMQITESPATVAARRFGILDDQLETLS